MPTQSLDRILQSQGFGTRKQCRVMVARGQVKVAGELVRDHGLAFEMEGLAVEVEGTPWRCRAQAYLALHKPVGYECSRKPEHHQSVLSLLPLPFTTRGVQPAGRLDQDASGLLLLSDDGAFIHAISSPKQHVARTYLVTTRDPVTPELVARLMEGVQLRQENQPVAALACRAMGFHQLELKIDQGKYHQVKRMLAAAGTACEALQRTAIGNLTLETLGLENGQWCELGVPELELLRNTR
jgi:16S rRNA pseudouridine516 synthase